MDYKKLKPETWYLAKNYFTNVEDTHILYFVPAALSDVIFEEKHNVEYRIAGVTHANPMHTSLKELAKRIVRPLTKDEIHKAALKMKLILIDADDCTIDWTSGFENWYQTRYNRKLDWNTDDVDHLGSVYSQSLDMTNLKPMFDASKGLQLLADRGYNFIALHLFVWRPPD